MGLHLLYRRYGCGQQDRPSSGGETPDTLRTRTGGKNPTIVHPSAKLKVAARRIANGRFMNSGQVCTAPDNMLVWPEVKDELIKYLHRRRSANSMAMIRREVQTRPIINHRNFDRLVALLGSGTIAAGGQTDASELYIAPTVLLDIFRDSPIMQEEVFGPIIPGPGSRICRGGDPVG